MTIEERITDLERRHAGRSLLNLGQFREHCPEEALPYEALRRLAGRDPDAAAVVEAMLEEVTSGSRSPGLPEASSTA